MSKLGIIIADGARARFITAEVVADRQHSPALARGTPPRCDACGGSSNVARGASIDVAPERRGHATCWS